MFELHNAFTTKINVGPYRPVYNSCTSRYNEKQMRSC